MIMITIIVFSNIAYVHIYNNVTQVWKDRLNNVKI